MGVGIFLSLDDLADPVLDHRRLALLDVEPSLGDEDAGFKVLVARAARLFICVRVTIL